MRSGNTIAIGFAGMSAMIAIAAYGQMNTVAPSGGLQAGAVDDAQGNLHVPDAYRTLYQSLGSWAVAADEGKGSKELHVVYASPGTITAHRRDGRFPDGTVLVKEVHEAATGQMTTGTVSRAGTLKGWFVMLRDSNRRYAANKLWGEGWVWSWFDAANPLTTTSTDFNADCRACHVP